MKYLFRYYSYFISIPVKNKSTFHLFHIPFKFKMVNLYKYLNYHLDSINKEKF